MVLPITDRIRYVNQADAQGRWVYKRTQIGKAQARPIDRVLQYSQSIQHMTEPNGGSDTAVGDAAALCHPPETILGKYRTAVSNRSYDKLKGLTANAALGVNVVEYRQARDMFATRGKQFVGLLLLLKRGKFATAGKALGCTFYNGKPPRRNRSGWSLPDYTRKTNISTSNLYLEWHFGLSPLIKDVQDAAKVLTDPIPNTAVQGSAEEVFQHVVRTEYGGASAGTYYQDRWETRVRHRQGCQYAITNPNLAMASQLGVLNPAALLWEIVPFSFVADWFVNVGDWLQGFSDFAGMKLDYAYSTSHIWSWMTRDRRNVYQGNLLNWGHMKGKYVTVDRGVGLTAPILSLRPLKLPSLTRVATTWSLLSQILQRR